MSARQAEGRREEQHACPYCYLIACAYLLRSSQVSFPGVYRSVCVELKVHHLAVNAILEVRS